VVREALSMQDFSDRVIQLDDLFTLALRVTASDRDRWPEIAATYGATATNPIDVPRQWDDQALTTLSSDERLAWVAQALLELARSYYGWAGGAPVQVAGNDIWSPDGLARALLDMSERSAED
jgi:hypothetical protein